MNADTHYVFDSGGVFAVTADAVYGGPLAVSQADAARRLTAGDDPAALIGNAAATGRKKVARRHVRRVAWIEDAGFLVVKQHWLWDPIRFAFADHDLGRRTFERLHRKFAPDAPVQTKKIGMHDLPVDPKAGLGLLFAFLGGMVVICGAVDTLPAGNVPGRGMFLGRVLADFGRELGPGLAFGLGGILLLAAMLALGVWFRTRPTMEFVRVR